MRFRGIVRFALFPSSSSGLACWSWRTCPDSASRRGFSSRQSVKQRAFVQNDILHSILTDNVFRRHLEKKSSIAYDADAFTDSGATGILVLSLSVQLPTWNTRSLKRQF
jgi:hypothetical protein